MRGKITLRELYRANVLVAVTLLTILYTDRAFSFVGNSLNYKCSGLFIESDQKQPQVIERSPATASRDISELKEFKVGTYNLLDFYIKEGKFKDQYKKEKSPEDLQKIADIIKAENYDILVAEEVQSVEAARIFSQNYLSDEYQILSTHKSDKRGLFVVFFVKKDLPFNYRLESHQNETWTDVQTQTTENLFPRDIPTLHVYLGNPEKPIFTVIGVHFKSKIDRNVKEANENPDMLDKESNNMRLAQANRATAIIQRYQMKYGYNHPILIAGDFNGSHNFEPEFYGFSRHAKLLDTIGLKSDVVKYTDRTTHTFFGKGGRGHHQLDGILITPSWAKALITAYVVAYLDENGNEKEVPRNGKEKKQNPSDHRPVTAIFSIPILLGQ